MQAAVLSGFAISFIVQPIEGVKARLQVPHCIEILRAIDRDSEFGGGGAAGRRDGLGEKGAGKAGSAERLAFPSRKR